MNVFLLSVGVDHLRTRWEVLHDEEKERESRDQKPKLDERNSIVSKQPPTYMGVGCHSVRNVGHVERMLGKVLIGKRRG